jgi:hypothetical protein
MISPDEIRARILSAAVHNTMHTVHPLPIPELKLYADELVRMRADGLLHGSDHEPTLTPEGLDLGRQLSGLADG